MAGNLMDIKQVAEYLQMNKMTVYKLAREGQLPAFKIASEWRFKKELLDDWLISQLKGKHKFDKFMLKHPPMGKTVLIVDDEKVIQEFFARVLTDYRVLIASTGEEALQVIKKDRPNLVLLDLKMPGIDGIETLRRIKEIDSSIAVIMLSAYGTLETNLEAARLGAYTSIAKPFDLKEMISVMQEAVNSIGGEEEAMEAVKVKKRNKSAVKV
jgi:excisionase family DNA binding protein